MQKTYTYITTEEVIVIMSGKTITEKILAAAAGKESLVPGTTEWVVPDGVFIYDWPGFSDGLENTLKELNVTKMPLADRTTIYIDHFVPYCGEDIALFHASTRRWAKEAGMNFFEGKGIGHQVAAELGMIKPGKFYGNQDAHMMLVGALGSLATGFYDTLTLLALGKIWITVPETCKVVLTGKMQPGVSGRDLFHKILADKGPQWGIDKVLEFTGDGAESMSIDERMNLLVMGQFLGITSCVFPFDDMARKYLEEHGVTEFEPVYSDEDASYCEVLTYDLSEIEPYVVLPGNPQNTYPLSKAIGIEVQQGYLGSCASGRLEDIQVAAKVLKGRKVKEGFRLNVIPTSSEAMAAAMRDGSLTTLVEAGAFVSSASCDYCNGTTQCLIAGEKAVSTGTLCVPGRMGSVDAEIYLTNAAAVAAAAIDGVIVDPRKYL